MKNGKRPKAQQDVSYRTTVGFVKVVAFKWPLKMTQELVIKRRQEMVTMSGKGKRQKAEILKSSRVMMLKEEVVNCEPGTGA